MQLHFTRDMVATRPAFKRPTTDEAMAAIKAGADSTVPSRWVARAILDQVIAKIGPIPGGVGKKAEDLAWSVLQRVDTEAVISAPR